MKREDRAQDLLLTDFCQKLQLAKDENAAKCALCGKVFNMRQGEGVVDVTFAAHGEKIIKHYCNRCYDEKDGTLAKLKKDREGLKRLQEDAERPREFPNIFSNDPGVIGQKIASLNTEIGIRENLRKPKNFQAR